MPHRGSFARALLALHAEPTFANLMVAYGAADDDNRSALWAAVVCAGVFAGGDLDTIYASWRMGRWSVQLPEMLEAEFPVLARLDEECEEPWAIPLRGQAPPVDLTADELTGAEVADHATTG